ncbi:BnaAnng04090D [Brassica napus]|uniref:BnaAnng04090D protein n=1 Tax=Brassica napus TaxID=3708 RepID=A0A078GZP7_BRANA|nr:BnaAnng04090D [Brassica napus]
MFVGTGHVLICLLGTGNQTFAERENSFQVSETVCGFFNVNGGFRISDEDKICEVAKL